MANHDKLEGSFSLNDVVRALKLQIDTAINSSEFHSEEAQRSKSVLNLLHVEFETSVSFSKSTSGRVNISVVDGKYSRTTSDSHKLTFKFDVLQRSNGADTNRDVSPAQPVVEGQTLFTAPLAGAKVQLTPGTLLFVDDAQTLYTMDPKTQKLNPTPPSDGTKLTAQDGTEYLSIDGKPFPIKAFSKGGNEGEV